MREPNLAPALVAMFFKALAGQDGPSECTLPDGRVGHLERAPGPDTWLRVRVESADGAVAYPHQAFEAASRRPGGYPFDLPFVPGHRVLLHLTAGSRALIWPFVHTAPALIDELTRQSTDDGWKAGRSGWLPFGARVTLRRAGATRTVLAFLLPPMVVMTESEQTAE